MGCGNMQKKRKVNKKVLVVLMLFLLIKQIIVPLIVSAQSHEVMNGSFISESLPVEEENREEQSQQVEENAESAIEDADALSDTSEPPETEEEKPEEEQSDSTQETDEITDEQPPALEPVPESEKVEDEKEEPSETEKPEVEEDNVVEEDEYNPGAMLDGFPAMMHPNNPTPIKWFLPGAFGSRSALRQNNKNIKSTTTLQPGEVRTSKTAKRVPGMVNTWDITVRIEGRDRETIETTNVVLVIDRSGSMDDNNRMNRAKSAAKNFIDTMLSRDANLKIGIVSFSSDYRTSNPRRSSNLVDINSGFTNVAADLKTAVDSLFALGGTHTQAGIMQGQALFGSSEEEVDNKYMVLLSDGQPTYSYAPTGWETVSEQKPGYYFGQDRGIFTYNNEYGNGNYNTDLVVGTGNTMVSSTRQHNFNTWPHTISGTEYYPLRPGSGYTYNPVNLRYIDNGRAAIHAANTAKNNVDGLFTIAVEAGIAGTAVLNSIATTGMDYSTNNPNELTEIYNRIATQISRQYALRNVKLVDEMGDGFSLVAETIQTTEGDTAVANPSAGINQKITWTINDPVMTEVPNEPGVRYAEMTYRVEINDGILALDGAKTDAHKLFNTNKLTELSYTDTNDENQTKPIESPEVDPVLLRIKKVLKDEYGNILKNDPRLFHVAINHDEGKYHHTESLVSDDTFVWLTTLRHEGSYHTQETGITGVGTNDLTKFQTIYIVDGKEQQTFLVNHDENKVPRKDVEITVINQLIPLTTAFSFTKTDGNGKPLEGAQFTLDRIENNQIVETVIGTGKTTFTFDNLKEGTYRLMETVAPDGYHLPTTSWEIIIVRNTALQTLEIQLPDDPLLSFDSDRGYEIKNERQAVFPDTGASGVLPFVVVGMIITASFTGYYNKKEKQWRKKDDKEI